MTGLADFRKPKYGDALVGLLYFALLLSINLTCHTIGDYGAETNFYGPYVHQAQSFLRGQVVVGDYHGPLYPIVLALAYLPVKDFFAAGILLATASAALIVFLARKLLRKLFNPKEAVGVTALLALNPVLIQHSYSAGSDLFFVLLMMLSVFVVLTSEHFRWGSLILASGSAALAYLTRYNGIALLPATLFIVLVINHWQLRLKKRVLISLIYLVLFLLFISPWGIYCFRQKGAAFYNQNFKTMAYELYAEGRVTYEDFWFGRQTLNIDSFTDVLTHDPVRLGKRLISNLGSHFVKDMKWLLGAWPLGVFVLLGLFYSIRKKPTRSSWAIYVYSLSFYAVLLSVPYDARYSIFLVFCYSILIMNGLQFIGGALRSPRAESWLVIALVAATAQISLAFNKRQIASGPVEVRRAAAWYLQNVPPQDRGRILLARKPHLAYYTNMEFQVIPMAAGVEDLQEKLRTRPGDYLFISPIEVLQRENLRGLLEPKNAPSTFLPIYSAPDPPCVLYRIKRTP